MRRLAERVRLSVLLGGTAPANLAEEANSKLGPYCTEHGEYHHANHEALSGRLNASSQE